MLLVGAPNPCRSGRSGEGREKHDAAMAAVYVLFAHANNWGIICSSLCAHIGLEFQSFQALRHNLDSRWHRNWTQESHMRNRYIYLPSRQRSSCWGWWTNRHHHPMSICVVHMCGGAWRAFARHDEVQLRALAPPSHSSLCRAVTPARQLQTSGIPFSSCHCVSSLCWDGWMAY